MELPVARSEACRISDIIRRARSPLIGLLLTQLGFRSCPLFNFFPRNTALQEGRDITTREVHTVKTPKQPNNFELSWCCLAAPLPRLSMLLCRVSAVSQTLARWGRRSHRGGGLLHRALSFSSSRWQGVGAGDGSAQPAETGSAQGLYRDTVLLPRTDFPMKLTGQKLLDRELEIQQVRRSIEVDDPSLKNVSS